MRVALGAPASSHLAFAATGDEPIGPALGSHRTSCTIGLLDRDRGLTCQQGPPEEIDR